MPISVALASLLGSGINAGTGLLNSALQQRTAKKNTNETIKENKVLADYQYNKNLENWNMQNAYNTPEAQMLRFEKAGLNPNLVYEKGTSGVSSAISPYQAPTVKKEYHPLQIPETISFWQNFAMKQAQTDNLRAQRDILQQTAQLNWMKTNNLSWQNQDLANKFLLNWGYEGPQNTKRLPLESSNAFKKWQLEFAGEKQRQDLNQFQLDLFKNGGKYFTPILQLLQLLKR